MQEPTQEQLRLFEKLRNEQIKANVIFSQRKWRGIWDSIIDKYPETAHFVYELLQNADDAEATDVTITVNHDELLFKHNGTKHFDITEDNVEPLGDINAITAAGNSTKQNTPNKIGKFGVGFKAVFQYTDRPEIYDDTFRFRIDDYIIPTLLDHDHAGRAEGETLFVFPFKQGQRCYEDITGRLEGLHNPTLFLHHLNHVTVHSDTGRMWVFTKTLTDTQTYEDGTLMRRFRLCEIGEHTAMFLFSKKVEIADCAEHGQHDISVGFYYNEQERHLITDIHPSLHCFFPTKENFGSCFVAHAPFLLTDNRQNLKPGETLNNFLLAQLATLAAKSLAYIRDYGKQIGATLINENIIELTSIDTMHTLNWADEDKRELLLESAFSHILRTNALLLTRGNSYVTMSDARTGRPRELVNLINKEQLNTLCQGNGRLDFLKWELDQGIVKNGNSLFCDVKAYQSEDFAHDLTAAFMQQQTREWVGKFYTFLRVSAPKLWKETGGKEKNLPFRIAPIIPTQRGKWVAPSKADGIPNVYLPLQDCGRADYNFVSNEYMDFPPAKLFFEELKLKMPNENDYILSVILAKYHRDEQYEMLDTFSGSIADHLSDMEVLLAYHHDHGEDEMLDAVKKSVLLYGTDGEFHRPVRLYDADTDLQNYLNVAWRVSILDANLYQPLVQKHGSARLHEFFALLGVADTPRVVERKGNYYRNNTSGLAQLPHRERLNFFYDWQQCEITDYELDGFEHIVRCEKMDKKRSLYLWNKALPRIAWADCQYLIVRYKEKYARYYDPQCEDRTPHESWLFISLRTLNWIYDDKGKARAASNIRLEHLAPEYNRDNGVAQLLGIEHQEKSIVALGGTQEQQDNCELGKLMKDWAREMGMSIEEMKQLMEQRTAEKREKEAALQRQASAASCNNRQGMQSPAQATSASGEGTSVAQGSRHYASTQNAGRSVNPSPVTSSACTTAATPQPGASQPPVASPAPAEQDEKAELAGRLTAKWAQKARGHVGRPHAHGSAEGAEWAAPKPAFAQPFFATSTTPDTAPHPQDGRTAQDFKRKSTEAGEQAKAAREQMLIYEMLDSTAKYTFRWFKLRMELMHADHKQATTREVQIDFAHWEQCGDTLMLTSPSRPVPDWIAEADSIQLVALSETSRSLTGKAVRIDETRLDIIAPRDTKLAPLCAHATRIRLNATGAASFLDALERRFLQLGYADGNDLNAKLPTHIQFIYGPPGTGKTTWLTAWIAERLRKVDKRTNILVLTPTNKAADVIAEMLLRTRDTRPFLTRFGTTESTELASAGVVLGRDEADMDLLQHNIVVATTARYAYDCVQPNDTAICSFPWDCVLLDEASMIDVVQATYVLHKSRRATLLVSGDPMQIQPVAQNGVPPENIYDMVGLRGFADAITRYTRFPVTALTTQHRAVPALGDLVSRFAYDGMVKTDVQRKPQKPLAVDGIDVKAINIIGFPIEEFDQLTGLNAVGGSALHLYAAIFTYNFAAHIARQIQKNHFGATYTMGIVCPYRAEADAIGQMLTNRPVNSGRCTVSCGTVHSFQGDECDIILVVLNPPASCTSGAHINNRSILNVAMSRARDYLFLIMPDSQVQGFTLREQIGRLAVSGDRTISRCMELERAMFGESGHIRANTAIACHLPVNVYHAPTAQYEVRMSDEALDIKIND